MEKEKRESDISSDVIHSFAVEDTSEGCYRDITAALLMRNMRQQKYKKNNKNVSKKFVLLRN